MDIKEFLPDLRKLIQGPLQTSMVDELLASVTKFCKESQIIRQTSSAQDKDAGDELAIVSGEAGLVPWGVVSVYSDGKELVRGTDYLQDSRTKITFIKKSVGVTVTFWCYPTIADQLPDALSGYIDAICSGAASNLFLYPSRPWFNAELANYHSRAFVEGHRKAWREIASDQFGEFQNPNVNVSFWM
jgi:hypothetical protein